MSEEDAGDEIDDLLALREELDVGPDEAVRWTVTEDGGLEAEIVEQRYGALSDLEPVDIGEETNAAEDHDLVAYGN